MATNKKALYARSINERTAKKLDKISRETNLPKTVIVDKLLSDSLKVKTTNKIDLSKYTGK